MIPVDQLIVPDRFDQIHHGDCMRACIASILELPTAAVPHCYDYDARTCADGSLAVERLQAWLGPRGLAYLELFVVEEHYLEFARHYLRGHHLMVGLAGVAEHAVVGYQGACVHDPHPRRTGVLPHSPKGADGVLGYTVGVLYLLGGNLLGGKIKQVIDELSAPTHGCDHYSRPKGVMGGPCLNCGRSQPDHVHRNRVVAEEQEMRPCPRCGVPVHPENTGFHVCLELEERR